MTAAARIVDGLPPVRRNGSGPPDTGEPSTWVPVDLGPVVAGLRDGTNTRPVPVVCRRSDEVGLFYPYRVNGLSGDSGSGKGWVALYACVQEMADGADVVYIDLEDHEDNIVGRLLSLGVAPELIVEQFNYIRPGDPYMAADLNALDELVVTIGATVVVIDSTGESMNAQSLKGNDDDHVTLWFKLLPRRLARLGPAVVVLDHVTKDKTTRGLWAAGSQRKRAAIDGATFMVDTLRPFGIGMAGVAKLTTAKDRNGTHPNGLKAGEFKLDARSDAYAVTLEAPTPSFEAESFRPTFLMEKTSRFIECHPDSSKNQVETAVSGKAAAKRLALDLLISEDYVTVTPGRRGALIHRSVHPYREGESGTSPDLVPTSSHLVPGRAQPTSSHLVSPLRSRGTRDEDEVDGANAPPRPEVEDF